jgi:D-alanine-D-alanine ligase
MNIVVLAGGNSPERAVSLTSGCLVCAALRRRGHRVLLLDVWRGLSDAEIGPDPMALFRGATGGEDEALPDIPGGANPVGENVLRLCGLADVVFLALHGAAGENGQVQAMLDCFGIPYTGSGHGASFIAMDKPLCKTLVQQGGVLTPDWCLLDREESMESACARVSESVGFPCVVKPCDGGSSVGVFMVDTPQELPHALAHAWHAGGRFMAEKRIFGRELTVAVLDGRALPAVEIIPRDGFYDYENKYIAGRTEEICPAPIGEAATAALAESAQRAFELIGLRSYARGDYMMDEEGRLWFLEFNTLPGMTPTSLLPQEAQAVGMSYEDLCEKIIELALRVANKI